MTFALKAAFFIPRSLISTSVKCNKSYNDTGNYAELSFLFSEGMLIKHLLIITDQ